MIAVLQPEPLFCVHIKDVYAAGAQMPAHIPENAQHILRRQNMVQQRSSALTAASNSCSISKQAASAAWKRSGESPAAAAFSRASFTMLSLTSSRIRHIRPCGARSRAARCRSRHPAPDLPRARRLPAAGVHSPHAVFADTQAQKSCRNTAPTSHIQPFFMPRSGPAPYCQPSLPVLPPAVDAGHGRGARPRLFYNVYIGT